MKKLLIILLIISVFPLIVYSQDNAGLFAKGNADYSKGNYLGAIENYKKINTAGFESPELYFNLGNCYYKLNKTADAILYFERAKLLAPGDDDIDFNLRIANLRTIDRFQTIPVFFLTDWYTTVKNSFSSGGWSTIAMVFLWVTLAGAGLFMMIWSIPAKKALFAVSIVSAIICISSFYYASVRQADEKARDMAIIYTSSVYVKSSPDAKSTDLFILHEGTKVKVLDGVGGWKKIKLANGNVGWLNENSIVII